IRRNTLLPEQRTYPRLDLPKRRRPQRKSLFNRRYPRPRFSNHGCPWIQKPSENATVMLWRGQPYGRRPRGGGSHDLSARTGGFAAGADYRVSPFTMLGFALAGGGTNWSMAQGLGGGRSDAFQ